MSSNPCFKVALEYLAQGMPVIPCRLYLDPVKNKVEKRPTVKWLSYQDKLPEEEELYTWWSEQTEAMVGMVTGPKSGLLVLDLDVGHDQELVAKWGISPTAPRVRTPSGGQHVYFKWPEGKVIKTKADIFNNGCKIDVRALGGFIVLPPSKYPNGVEYKWEVPLIRENLTYPPRQLLAAVEVSDKRVPTNFRPIAAGVSVGGRNQAAAQLVGLLVHYLPEKHWGSVVWPLVRAWNENNSPPDDEAVLQTTFMSICNKARFEKAKWFNNKSINSAEAVNNEYVNNKQV